MSDLIDRQAAIDKVDRIVKVNHLNPDMVWFTPNGVKTLMEDLPSAEPDDAEANYWHEKANSYEQTLVKLALNIHPEIIRCKECYWWTKQEDSLQGRCDRYGMYPTGYWYCAAARERREG